MRQRGRKSAAQLSVITSGHQKRPEPPDSLTDKQKEEWDAVVKRMPIDWFPRETHALLAQYCRHVTRADDIAQILEMMVKDRKKNFNPVHYTKLLGQEMRQSNAIATLATKMRLSQQSSYDKSKKKHGNELPRTEAPWGDDDDAADGTND